LSDILGLSKEHLWLWWPGVLGEVGYLDPKGVCEGDIPLFAVDLRCMLDQPVHA
jgi:hypothetical protein